MCWSSKPPVCRPPVPMKPLQIYVVFTGTASANQISHWIFLWFELFLTSTNKKTFHNKLLVHSPVFVLFVSFPSKRLGRRIRWCIDFCFTFFDNETTSVHHFQEGTATTRRLKSRKGSRRVSFTERSSEMPSCHHFILRRQKLFVIIPSTYGRPRSSLNMRNGPHCNAPRRRSSVQVDVLCMWQIRTGTSTTSRNLLNVSV